MSSDPSFMRARAGRALAGLVALAGVLSAGCGEPTDSIAAPSESGVRSTALADEARALRAEYGAHAGEVLDRSPVIAPHELGFELTRRGRALAEAPVDPTPDVAGLPTDTPPAIAHPSIAPLRMVLPADATAAIELHLEGSGIVRVREEGVRGRAERVEGAISYPREGGRSYWTESDERGYEEWLDIEAGRAHAGRELARWHVEGGTLREHEGAVLIADARGTTQLRVTAPRAWARSGRAVAATLGIDGDAITLEVDADGEAVLVDPLWIPTGSMAVARDGFLQGHGAVVLASGAVLVVGGYDGAAVLASAELYDPSSATWSSAAPMSTGRYSQMTTRLADGRVLVAGGRTVLGGYGVSSAEIYDPTTNSWSPASPMSGGHGSPVAMRLLDGRVLVAGGEGTATAEIYDPTTDSWSLAASMSTIRYGAAATLLADGRALVVGGWGGTARLATAEIYDPSTDTWSAAGAMSRSRAYHTATLLGAGRVLVAGGMDDSGITATAEIYDVSTNAWSPAPSMSASRYTHTATSLASGRVLVAAGVSTSASRPASAEIYDPASNTWSSTVPLSVGRGSHVAARLADGAVLIAGGATASGATASAELFLESTTCGNGLVEAGETCDDGNTVPGDCCSDRCSIEAAGTLCRAATRACDVAETCSGTSPVCPADAARPEGTACGPTPSGDCDAQDVCVGTVGATAICQVRFAPPTTVCRASAGVCDVPDMCSGTSRLCPGNRFATSGTACRASVDACDAAEACTGTSALCPADGLAPPSTICRPSIGACDVAEMCTGSSVSCPADAAQPEGTSCGLSPTEVCDANDVCVGTLGATATCEPRFAPPTTTCRPSAGVCDVAETCNGAALACPADGLAPPGTECRASAGECDLAEMCTGSSAACPADAAQPEGTVCGGPPSGICDAQDVCAGTVGASATCEARFASPTTTCRAAAGDCDLAESCTGSSSMCPADSVAPPSTTCRASTGVCDVADLCDGLSKTCPADVFAPSSAPCRAAAGDCDLEESCTGSSAACPPDVLAPASTSCRASVSECDVEETCTGSDAACPADAAQPEGTACGGAPSGECDAQDACAGTVGASASCEVRFAPVSTTCRAASCTLGVATMAASCSGADPLCPAPVTSACAPFACGADACLSGCASDADCAAESYCDATGACVPQADLGAACAADRECRSGECVDGVCCDTACTGQCEACDVAGSEGACTPVAGAPHGGRMACAGDGGLCDGACDGIERTGCTYPDASTTCRAGSCADGVATVEAHCDGSGACPAETTQSCAPFACSGALCDGDCATDTDCDASGFCSAGVCVAQLENGAICDRARQCGSGECVDGVCCESACAGQCEACDVAGSEGACTIVTGAPHGGREACADDGTACRGECDGTTRDACTYPDVTAVCGVTRCVDAVSEIAGTCDGAGSCAEGPTVDCAPYACGASACLDACTTDSDCIAGYVCAGGECTVPGPDGGAPDGGAPDGGTADGGSAGDAGDVDGGEAIDGGGAIDAALAGDAGESPDAGPTTAPSGCGCAVPGRAPRSTAAALALGMLALAWLVRRRAS